VSDHPTDTGIDAAIDPAEAEPAVPDATDLAGQADDITGLAEPTEATEGDPEPDSRAGREAAKYRTRLRAAEADLATARAALERVQRAAVQQMVASRLAVPADLFDIAGVDLATLLDQDGIPDADAVADAVATALRDRPGLARRTHATEALVGARRPPSGTPSGTTWQQVIRG